MKKLPPVLTLVFLFLMAAPAIAGAERAALKLPAPDLKGGRPLMAVLNDRRSDRVFGSEHLSDQQLADILWAAVGVNRVENGSRRTAPTARNLQDVTVYALTADGAFYYDALKHELRLVAEGDQTSILGAPLGLVYVCPADNKFAGANVGFSSQNVYLYAASEGLNTVVKGTFNHETLAGLLALPDDLGVVLVQLVGPRP